VGLFSPGRRKNARFLFVCALSLFSAVTPLFAGAKADPLLRQADDLVKAKKYNEALRLLTEFVREDDIRFDAAQKRIRKILKQFGNYEELVHKLMDTIEKTPDDFDAIVAIADQLRESNAAHDENTRRFVGRVQEFARFTVNRRIIEDILREGRALIDAGDYIGAIRKYQSGFAIYEVELWESSFWPRFEQNVEASLAGINEAIGRSSSLLGQLNSVRAAVALMPNHHDTPQNRDTLNNAFNSLIPQLDALIQIKEVFARAERFFTVTGELPEVEESAQSGRHFFPMAALFMRGRGNQDVREGMLGAVDALWRSAVIPLSDAYGDILEELYRRSESATSAENYTLAQGAISATKAFITRPLALSEKSETFVGFDQGIQVSGSNRRIFSAINESIVRFQAMDNALDRFSRAAAYASRFSALRNQSRGTAFLADWEAGRISADEALRALRGIRDNYHGLRIAVSGELGSIKERVDALLPDAEQQGRPPLPGAARPDGAEAPLPETPLRAALRYYGDSYRIIEKLDKGIYDAELKKAEEMYAKVNENLKTWLADFEKRGEEADRLIEGVELAVAEGQTIQAKYPREASEILRALTDDLAAGVESGEKALEEYRVERARPAPLEELRPYEEEATRTVDDLRSFTLREERELNLALENAGRAESLRRDGERLLTESRAALEENDFDRSRERLEGTAARFVESLEIQENPDLRGAWTARLDPLSEEISRREYDYIVREVRELINGARDRYFASNFERAEASLLRAESRWARIEPLENEEVSYWLALVRGALALRYDSAVPITAPRYPEVSQLLSDAKKNYNDGVTLFKASKREEGMMKFATAKEKTQEIKLMFPVNQEAGILELRIDQVIDPSTFEEAFRQRFVTAVAGTKRGSRESYLELENLAEINPRFSGMQAALTEAKYDIGLLPRPLDSSVAREAESLAVRAQRLFSARNFDEALRTASEALRLDPNNAQAMRLIDRARLSMGSANSVLADPAAEQEYYLAVREFQEGRNILALARVERLLQNPANRNNTRFNALRRRIAATL
jgi:thioredoxin-like negative regulator of GroEL